jgi:hypothetical protein
MSKRHSFFLVLATLAAAAVSAHDFWIEPSSFRVEKGAHLDVALARGRGLPRRSRGAQSRQDPPLRARRAGGASSARRRRRQDPAGSAEIAGQGLFVIGYHSHPSSITLERRSSRRTCGRKASSA